MNKTKLWLFIDVVIPKVTKWAMYVPVACIAYIMTIATIDVITTKFFNRPIPSTYEFIETLNIPLVFMAMAYVQLERGHIAGALFEKKLSKTVNKAIAVAGYMVGILVCGAISWGAARLMQDMIATKQTKLTALDFPTWPFALIIILSFALLAVAYIVSIVRALAKSESSEVKDVTSI
jgi:TRAP-type C4-dicarboxylate transport system permease small subunit